MQQLNDYDIVYIRSPINWTPELCKLTREKLKISRKEMADIFGVSPPTIFNLEHDKVKNPMALMMYGTALERICALRRDYIPGFRKIGTNDFMQESMCIRRYDICDSPVE